MYWSASADSDALNFVVAPISFAFSSRAAKSSLVAPEIAWTFDMAASKSEPTLMDATLIAPIAVAVPVRMAPVAFKPFSAILPMPLIPDWNPEESILVSNFSVPS